MFSQTTILLVSLPWSCGLLCALQKAIFYDKQTFCESKTHLWKHIPPSPISHIPRHLLVTSWFDSASCSRTWSCNKHSSDLPNLFHPKKEAWGLRLRQSTHCPCFWGPAPHLQCPFSLTWAVCFHLASIKLPVPIGICVPFLPYFLRSQPAHLPPPKSPSLTACNKDVFCKSTTSPCWHISEYGISDRHLFIS